MATTEVTTSAGLAAEVRIAYDNVLLQAAKPELVHAQFGNKRPIPKNQGKTIQMRRFELLAAATTALTEGVTPSGSVLSVTPVTMSVNQYGDFVQFSDVVSWVSIDPVITETVRLQGQQAGNTIDQLARDVYVTGTNVGYTNSRTSRVTVAAGDIITGADVKKAVRNLKRNNVKRLNGDYVAIIHPDTAYDIMGITEWLAAKEYGTNQNDLYNGELGKLYGVRFVETTNAKIFAGAGAAGINVYATLFFGDSAFGTSEITGEAMETIMHPLGSAGSADALNQRQTAGWKVTFGSTILNETYVYRLEHATTA